MALDYKPLCSHSLCRGQARLCQEPVCKLLTPTYLDSTSPKFTGLRLPDSGASEDSRGGIASTQIMSAS